MFRLVSFIIKNKTILTISGFIFLFVLLVSGVGYDSIAGEQQKINIDITTHLGDVTNFIEGDRVSFLVSLDRDAYIMLVYQNAKGEITQLLPNKRVKNNFYRAGLFLTLPASGEAFVFDIQPPFGSETLWVFAADAPLPELEGSYLKDGLKKLTVGIDAIRSVLSRHPKSAYGESRLDLQTRPRN